MTAAARRLTYGFAALAACAQGIFWGLDATGALERDIRRFTINSLAYALALLAIAAGASARGERRGSGIAAGARAIILAAGLCLAAVGFALVYANVERTFSVDSLQTGALLALVGLAVAVADRPWPRRAGGLLALIGLLLGAGLAAAGTVVVWTTIDAEAYTQFARAYVWFSWAGVFGVSAAAASLGRAPADQMSAE